MAYAVSPAVSKVDAWRRREGETLCGIFEDNSTPEVVIAKLMKGTACESN